MTKKEEQAIDKKYAEGKGTYINAETEKKMIRLIERQKTKRERNRIKKIFKQTMVEEQMLIEKLTQEIKELKARNEYLEKLKDKDSDIPVEEEKHLIKDELDDCYKDFDDLYNTLESIKEELPNIPEEKPDKNSDIPSFIENRFQEFIDKKYIGPAEATILWCGLNEIPSHNPPKFKANGYIPCERNTTKLKNGYTPQQIIVASIIDQMQQQHIEIINEKLKEKFYNTLRNMAM